MTEAIRQMLIGFSSILIAPSGDLPKPNLRITLPPENATSAIAFDLSRIAGDLRKSIDTVEHAQQLKLI